MVTYIVQGQFYLGLMFCFGVDDEAMTLAQTQLWFHKLTVADGVTVFHISQHCSVTELSRCCRSRSKDRVIRRRIHPVWPYLGSTISAKLCTGITAPKLPPFICAIA